MKIHCLLLIIILFVFKSYTSHAQCVSGDCDNGFGRKKLYPTSKESTSNKVFYEGQFKNGLPHGKGILYQQNSMSERKTIGYWKKGKQFGFSYSNFSSYDYYLWYDGNGNCLEVAFLNNKELSHCKKELINYKDPKFPTGVVSSSKLIAKNAYLKNKPFADSINTHRLEK